MEYLAQIATDIGPFAQWGAMGLMLWWFMQRVERLLTAVTSKLDTLSRAILLDVINRENGGLHTKQSAREALAKLDAEDTK
jgi:hypothetical protein